MASNSNQLAGIAANQYAKFSDITAAGCVAGQALRYNGTNFVCENLVDRANNLSDLVNVVTARSNLGLGSAAVLNAPSSGDATAAELVKGNDSRLTGTIDSARLPASATAWSVNASSDVTYSSGNVGIGTTNPSSLLTVSLNATSLPAPPTDNVAQFSNADGLGSRVTIDSFGGNGNLSFRRSNGTNASKLSLTAGNNIGAVAAFGYGATGYSSTSRGGFSITAAENWTDTAQGTNLYFSTTNTGAAAATNKMIILSSGNVGIGNTSPVKLLHVGSNAVGTGVAVANFQNIDGTCTITPAAAGSGIACSSDERLKENFQNVQGLYALDRILKLQAVTYNFKTASAETRRTGYKAQEIQKVAPEFVRQNDDGYFQVYYDGLIPWITETIKILYNRIVDVENKARQIASKADKIEIEMLKVENAELKARADKTEKENASIRAYLCDKDPNAVICK